MAKSQIRWNPNDETELRKAVRNFNQQRRRALAKDPASAEYLPAVKRMKEVRAKAQSETRRGFGQIVKELRSISKPGALTKVETVAGVTTTKYEMDRIKHLEKRANLKAKAKQRYTDVDYKKGLDDPEIQREFKQRHEVLELKKPDEFKKYAELLEKNLSLAQLQANAEQYKANYIKAIEANMGEYAETMIKTIKQIPAEALGKLTIGNVDTKIEFYYKFATVTAKFNRVAEIFSKAGYKMAYDSSVSDADYGE